MFSQNYQIFNAVTNFLQKKLNAVLALVLEVTLNKSVMVAKFPRNALYGSDLYERMNIQHPYYKQGIQKIITCIQECAIASQTGNLIKTKAEAVMLKT